MEAVPLRLTRAAQELFDDIGAIPVVDAHEHLPSERAYLGFEYSGLNLFAGYLWHDLESAGLDPTFKASMRDGGYRPVEEWWPRIRPFWEQVRHTSYARALRHTVRDLFGLPDVDDSTIVALAEAVRAENRPGVYRRVLQQRCHIRTSITCVDQAAFPEDPGLRGITMLEKGTGRPAQIAEALAARCGRTVRTLEDAVQAGQQILRREVEQGAVGFKTMVAEHRSPDPAAAERQWRDGLRAPEAAGPAPAVGDLLFDRLLDVAAEVDLPVAVHTGYWGDFRALDPKLLFSFALRRRDVRFDLFHLGMPMVRDALLMGKTLPNVTLNLTWCPIISQAQTVQALDEIVDLVPTN
jgi:hypothetical protein